MKRDLLNKSKYIIGAIFVIVLCVGIFVSKVYHGIYKSNNRDVRNDRTVFLTNSYDCTKGEFNDFLSDIADYTSNEFALIKTNDLGVYGFIGDVNYLNLRIVEGKCFQAEELRSDDGFMLVNENRKSDVFKEGGQTYIYYDADKYHVLGFFKADQTNSGIRGYYNLSHILSKEGEEDARIVGSYSLSTNEDINIQNLVSEYQSIYLKQSKLTLIDQIDRALADDEDLGEMLVIIILMLLLSSASIGNNWCIVRKNEFRVLFLLGMTRRSILIKCVREYGVIAFITWLCVLLFISPVLGSSLIQMIWTALISVIVIAIFSMIALTTVCIIMKSQNIEKV